MKNALPKRPLHSTKSKDTFKLLNFEERHISPQYEESAPRKTPSESLAKNKINVTHSLLHPGSPSRALNQFQEQKFIPRNRKVGNRTTRVYKGKSMSRELYFLRRAKLPERACRVISRKKRPSRGCIRAGEGNKSWKPKTRARGLTFFFCLLRGRRFI